MIELLLALGAILSFVFGWNNSSFLIGNLRGSGTLTARSSVLLAVTGLLAGVLLEGSKMLKSLDGALATSASAYGLEVTFFVSILLTIGLTLLALPASISAAMVGAFLGVAVASSLSVNQGQTYLVITFWFVAPVLTYFVSLALHRALRRLVSGLNLVAADSFNRVGVVATSFAVSYSLGANNIGLIYGTALGGAQNGDSILVAIGLTFTAIAGTILLGKRKVSETLGDKMLALSPQGVLAAFGGAALLVWTGTQFQVPMSISHCILGGMLGAAYSSRITVINRRIVSESLSTWVVIPVVAFIAAFLLFRLSL
ncbi:MAG: inorganic phosphate transporter [Thaumarchaeota archaeon]|nr:inorganic phosphate transporter [Nitrososphaerota archaeon]